MKKSIFLSFILCLCLVACIPQQAMAQKQSRMEKLLRYLNDNDADKWQKNREKLDDETKAYYAEDLSLMYKRQNKLFHFHKTFCSEFDIINTKQNVHFTKVVSPIYQFCLSLHQFSIGAKAPFIIKEINTTASS